MRFAHHAVWGLVALSCATEETLPLGDRVGNEETGGTDATSAGSGGGGTAPAGVAGTEPKGGGGMMTTAGTSPNGGGGAAGDDGGGSNGGSFVVGGSGGAMAGGGAGGNSGAGGAGGKGGAGGAGGKGGAGSAGGSGGKGGSGGSGGSGTVACGAPAIPAQTLWKATALAECSPTCADPNGPFTAGLAIDGNVATRYSSGATQVTGQWLQIDLGTAAAVNHLTLNSVPAADYTRHYQVRVSNTSVDMAASVLAEGDGAAGVTDITLSKVSAGRFVLITQTGAVTPPATSWWSINEITVTCQ